MEREISWEGNQPLTPANLLPLIQEIPPLHIRETLPRRHTQPSSDQHRHHAPPTRCAIAKSAQILQSDENDNRIIHRTRLSTNQNDLICMRNIYKIFPIYMICMYQSRF